jgi:hypothetical protein
MSLPMFSITGELRKVYSEKQVDKETGEEKTKHRIQILGEIPLRDDSGDTREDMVTLTVDNPIEYRDLVKQNITVPFGFFSPQKGSVVTFVPKGSKPQMVGA